MEVAASEIAQSVVVEFVVVADIDRELVVQAMVQVEFVVVG